MLAFIYLYDSFRLINCGAFADAQELYKQHEETLFRKLSQQKLDVQLLLQLNLVVLHLVCDRGGEARKAMTRIQATGLVFYNFPAFRIARLVNLLLQAECGRFDFAENEIKSIRRSTAIGNSSVENLFSGLYASFRCPGAGGRGAACGNGCTVRCRQLRPINTSGRYSNTSILRHGSRRA